jgi:hypothetical protein
MIARMERGDKLAASHTQNRMFAATITELPTPPAKPQWMLSPSQEAAPDLQPLAAAHEQEGTGGGEEATQGAQAPSDIALAMKALEEEACPRKRTMTRFTFVGGASFFRIDGRVGDASMDMSGVLAIFPKTTITTLPPFYHRRDCRVLPRPQRGGRFDP